MSKRIAVLGVPGRWSSEHLADAVAERTGERLLLSVEDLTLDLSSGRVTSNGLDLRDLDALVVKKISHSYAHDVLDRLELLRVLEQSGVRVMSSPEALARALNRLTGTIQLWEAGVPLPSTVITEKPEDAAEAVKKFGSAILKPLFTSKSRGMTVVEAGDTDLIGRIREFQSAGNQVLYVQQRVSMPGWDLGLAFLGGEYVATYARQGSKGAWSTATAFGGRYGPYEPSAEIVELARRAQAGFGLDFTCVDVAETPNGPVVFEVSAFGGFRGLLEAHGIDVAEPFADYVLDRLADD